MRCSLLTLSTYLDGELAPDRSGEVEAHLVACQRCSSGLGYLREEKGHISALAVVHADDGAAEDLLGSVGLALLPAPVTAPPEPAPQFLLDLAESPRPSPVPPLPDESGKYLELNGSPSPLAAPEMRAPAETLAADPADLMPAESLDTHANDHVDSAPHEVDTPLSDERVEEVAPPVTPTPPAPPQWSQSYARETPLAHARDSAPPSQPSAPSTPEPETVVPQFLVDTAVDATEQAVVPPHPAPKRPSPSVALSGRASSLLGRARDAVTVRWALMRGPSIDDIDEDDDSIQIVSGTGAPERRGSRANRTDRDAFAPSKGAVPDAAQAFAPTDDDTPDISFAPPEHTPLQRPAFTAQERLAARAAMEKLAAEGVLARDETPSQGGMLPTRSEDAVNEPPRRSFSFDIQEQVAPPGEFPRPLPRDDEPAQPGRHQRRLSGDGSRFKLPTFTMPTMPRPARRAPSRPSAVASPLGDRRLWIFGSVVLVALLIGLLVGKSVTPATHTIAPGAVPNPTAIALPSAHASAAPTAAATPASTPRPTPLPTPTPVPTPVVANPNQLTGAQNLGDGGTGFTVQDIRYGAHPGDFRIVFDLSGSGSPTTTVGFGNATTLYVIFTGATGPASVAQPSAGNTATAVKLLQPSPIAGKTIYEFTLSGPAKLSTLYLQSPVRLVIDLS